jgi:hypothetical protein
LVANGTNATAAASIAGTDRVDAGGGARDYTPLERRFAFQRMAIIVFGMLMVSVVMLLAGTSMVWVFAFVGLYGMAVGAITLVRPPSFLAELYGSAHYGQISSIQSALLHPVTALAPWGRGGCLTTSRIIEACCGFGLGFSAAATLTLSFFHAPSPVEPYPHRTLSPAPPVPTLWEHGSMWRARGSRGLRPACAGGKATHFLKKVLCEDSQLVALQRYPMSLALIRNGTGTELVAIYEYVGIASLI